MKITLTELRQLVRNIINESRFKTKFPFKADLEFEHEGKIFKIKGEVWSWDEPIEFSSIKINGGKDISYHAYNKANDEEIEKLFGMSLGDFEELALEKVKNDDGEKRGEAEKDHYLSHNRFDRYGDY
jgi:hypothetical protein